VSRFNIMPRAYRKQLQAQDTARIAQLTRTTTDENLTGSAGRLRGIPAIGPNCPGHIRDTDPEGHLLRGIR
jgi:hypothetical protein